MGPREPAEVTLVGRLSINDLLWVANTRHGPAAHWHARVRGDEPGHDHLLDPDDARRYLADHRVPVPAGQPDPSTLERLRLVRDAVDRLFAPDADPDAGRPATVGLPDAEFHLDRDGSIHATGAGWAAFVGDLMPPLLALSRQRARLGRCGNPACRLAFLDDTRNRGRRWCDPGGCGNRVRVRRARLARLTPPPVGQPPVVQPPR
jgi:hypothetical protein